jgi:phospholipid/cholesterol/gamma-HCH transport system ATP-binding protein
VTHELASIFAIGTYSVFLDMDSKTMIASGPPKQLLAESRDPKVLRFLTRGASENSSFSAIKHEGDELL